MSSLDTGGNTPSTSSNDNSNSDFNSSSFHPWQPIFLAALCQTGSVAHAAQAAGISRQNAYLARSTQSRWGQDRLYTLAFAEVWREALLYAAETIEVELRRRALEGEEREKRHYYKGECVDVQKYRVYDNRLLLHLAKLVLPTYKDRETFDFPATLRPPTLLENQFARLDENDLDELEELTNLASDLWGQVLDILDGSPTPDAEEDDDEATEAEAETAPETADSLVSSPAESSETTSANAENTFPPLSDSQMSSELDTKAPSSLAQRQGKGDATEGRLGLTADSQVSSEALPVTSPPPYAQHMGEGSGVGAIPNEDPQVSSEPDLPPPGAAPQGALIYDIDNAFKRLHGLT